MTIKKNVGKKNHPNHQSILTCSDTQIEDYWKEKQRKTTMAIMLFFSDNRHIKSSQVLHILFQKWISSLHYAVRV